MAAAGRLRIVLFYVRLLLGQRPIVVEAARADADAGIMLQAMPEGEEMDNTTAFRVDKIRDTTNSRSMEVVDHALGLLRTFTSLSMGKGEVESVLAQNADLSEAVESHLAAHLQSTEEEMTSLESMLMERAQRSLHTGTALELAMDHKKGFLILNVTDDIVDRSSSCGEWPDATACAKGCYGECKREYGDHVIKVQGKARIAIQCRPITKKTMETWAGKEYTVTAAGSCIKNFANKTAFIKFINLASQRIKTGPELKMQDCLEHIGQTNGEHNSWCLSDGK